MSKSNYREPKQCNSMRLVVGQFFATWTKDSMGRNVGMGEGWTVTEITRRRIVFSSDTGDQIILVR
jgi:hypothetical protein